jgi:hypothetical protein
MVKRTAFLLTLALCATAAFGADYSGTWKLDLEASNKLPERMKSRLASWNLDVKNDARQLVVDVSIGNNDGSAMKNNFVYKLDGSESPIELTVRTPDGDKKIAGVSVAKAEENGVIALSTTTELPFNGEMFKRVSSERWTLSDAGKTLTVHRVDPNPMGTNEYDLVFRKQ